MKRRENEHNQCNTFKTINGKKKRMKMRWTKNRKKKQKIGNAPSASLKDYEICGLFMFFGLNSQIKSIETNEMRFTNSIFNIEFCTLCRHILFLFSFVFSVLIFFLCIFFLFQLHFKRDFCVTSSIQLNVYILWVLLFFVILLSSCLLQTYSFGFQKEFILVAVHRKGDVMRCDMQCGNTISYFNICFWERIVVVVVFWSSTVHSLILDCLFVYLFFSLLQENDSSVRTSKY